MGFVGCGFSLSGGMIESEAVIGSRTDGVQSYRLLAMSTAGVKPDPTLKISDGSITVADGVTHMTFTRTFDNGGKYTIQLNEPNHMVFSFSPDGTDTVTYHGGLN